MKNKDLCKSCQYNTGEYFLYCELQCYGVTKTDGHSIATKRTQKTLKDGYLTKEETKVAISAMAESIELEVSKTYKCRRQDWIFSTNLTALYGQL